MLRLVIFGNSGSGKSTLAKQLSSHYSIPHLDLDTLAWNDTTPPTRKPIEISREYINTFTKAANSWVIEGCYADLLSIAIEYATEIVFLNPGIDICISNAKNRPWEPHKYSSPDQQNANLPMLIDWIQNYEERSDEFSLKSHRDLFEGFKRKKTEYNSNDRKYITGSVS